VKGEELDELKSGLKESETARAREVWRRKFNRVPQDAEERSKQMRFLMSRGFSTSAVRAALKGQDDDEA
jgi:regulatory protein